MYSLLMALASVWPTPNSTPSPRMVCPRIQLIQINLAHRIDRGVYMRTRKRCSKLYKKSPCLVKLEQIKTGAFNVTCGEKIALLQDTPDNAVEEITADDTEAIAVCLTSIFTVFPDESNHPPDPRLGQEVMFCPDSALQ